MLKMADKGAAVNAIQAIEARYRNRLQSLPAHIAVIDPAGCIKLTNSTWTAFANDNGGQCEAYVGKNYLDICRASASSDVNAEAAYEGIISVLNGDSPRFTMEYPCHGPSEERWFCMEVAPLDSRRRIGAIVSHSDITETKFKQLALRETVSSIQTSLSVADGNASQEDFSYYANRQDTTHIAEINDTLYETVINAHFLAAQMLVFAKRKDFSLGDETGFLVGLINRWAQDIGTDLFNGKRVFDGESRS